MFGILRIGRLPVVVNVCNLLTGCLPTKNLSQFHHGGNPNLLVKMTAFQPVLYTSRIERPELSGRLFGQSMPPGVVGPLDCENQVAEISRVTEWKHAEPYTLWH